MPKKDPRVDAYIAKNADFAKPILTYLRKHIHAACPDVSETVKWGVPFYEHQGILCSTAAFKQHCMFILWNKALKAEYKKLGTTLQEIARLRRFSTLEELPKAPVLKRLVAESARLNAAGVKGPMRPPSKPKPKLATPADLQRALAKNKQAKAAFEAFTPGKRNEYIEWITSAKRDETRAKRLTTAVEWIAEGKSRNWKYQNC